LWLKEIIIVVPEGENEHYKLPIDTLNIVHQYLLVYEVK